MIPLVIFIAACIILFFAIFFISSRGRVKPKIFIFEIGYGILVAIPFFMINYYQWIVKNFIGFMIFLIIALALLLPSLSIFWYNIIKKRYPVMPVIFLTTAIVLIILSSCIKFNHYLSGIILLSGLLFMFPYFIFLFRKPYLDTSWLESVSQEAAARVQKSGVYTSKPIIILHNSKYKFLANTFGMSLFFKEDKVICYMTKRAFEKLNRPALTEFFTLIVQKIDEQIEKKNIKKKEN